MSEFINTAYEIGDDALVDSIIMRTITEYREDRITKVGQYAFYGCTALETVDAPNITTIEGNAFNGCTALTALILRGETLCALSNTSAFTGSAVANGTAYIYVRAAVLAEYQAATNWSTYASQFRALEDYTVDGTVWGELDESKIAA